MRSSEVESNSKLAVLVVGNGPEIKPGLEELKLGPVQTVDISIPQPGKKQ